MDIIKKIKNYTLNQRHCLGQGSFGRVYEATSDEGRKVAIKKVDQKLIIGDRYLRESLDNEILIMQKLKHPNIVELYEVITTANNIYLVMEYCSGGDLKRYCSTRKINQEKAFDILKQICRGFEEMSKLGVIHRDLKPANILVHQDIFKICDFGFAKFFSETGKMARTCVGTPIYMSPQVLKQKQYTSKTDVWSMGVLFFQLLFGRLPYNGYSEDDLYKNIQKGPLQIPECNKQAKVILQNTLAIEEKDRWGWPEFLEYMFGKAPIGIQRVGRANTPKQPIFYKEESSENTIEQDKRLDKRVYQKIIPANNNYFSDDRDPSPADKGQRQAKRGPKNMFAAQNQIDQYSPAIHIQPIPQPIQPLFTPSIPIVPQQKETEQNPRFLYFILIEFAVNPIDALSFDSFIYNLWRYTIDLYERLLKKDEINPITLYRRVLENELKEIKSLQDSIKIMKDGNVRNIADILFNEAKVEPKNRKKVIWLRRFMDKKYTYEPVD